MVAAKSKIVFLAFSAASFVYFFPAVAFAHPESGFLPDAVAETEYKIVLEINPQDITTRNKLGIVLYRKNKVKEAEKAFTEVLKLSPANFDAHDGMGLVKIKERKYEEAVQWFKKAIKLSSEDTMVHYNMGFALEQLQRYKDAEKSYKRSLDINSRMLGRGLDNEAEAGKKDIVISALKNLQSKMKSGK